MKDKTQLPFNSDNDDEATIWFDVHGTADLPEKSVNVTVRRKSKELQSLTLRIDLEDMKQLKKLADEAGVGHTTMARMLLHRELKNTPKVGSF